MKIVKVFRDPLSRALYQSCQGSLDPLAGLLGITRQRVANKANPNDTAHYFSPHELVDLQRETGDYSILHALAAELDHVAIPISRTGPLGRAERLAVVAAKHADYWYGVTDRLQGAANDDELRATWHASAAQGLALIEELEVRHG